MCVCVYVHACAGAWGGQKRAPDSLKLEVQVVVSCLTSVLGTNFTFSAREVYTLNS